jgi:orotate phosphoribosyltransferase
MTWNGVKERYGKEIIRDLHAAGMIRTWYRDNPEGWTLISGVWSPFYLQLRPLSCYPALLRKVGEALGILIKEEIPLANRCVGIAMAGIPIATAISLMEDIPSGFTRKLEGVHSLSELKTYLATYGEHALVEGIFEEGDHVVLIDDLVTKFDSKLIAREQFRSEMARRNCEDISAEDVVVLLDREQGAKETAAAQKIRLHSLIPFRSKGLSWLSESLSDQEYRVLTEYLENPDKFQDKVIQARLRTMARAKVK